MAATPPAFLNRQPLALYEAPRRLPLALDTRKGLIAMCSALSRLAGGCVNRISVLFWTTCHETEHLKA